MDDGVTLIAPETVWFAWDTRLGRDVLIEPNVFFGPGVRSPTMSRSAPLPHRGRRIASGCEVGPFARLRPGAVLEGEGQGSAISSR
jgi:bifunctional UDP-N-acetylglucosamine pyrophosphorylase/glucosamine-1-phosphate N-acetyltransferase